MAVLKVLSVDQIELLGTVRNEWLGRFFSLVFDELKAKAYVDFLYSLVGKPAPMKLVLDSPFALQVACGLLQNGVHNINNQVRNEVISQVWNQVSSQISDQVSDQVRIQVHSQVNDQVWSQVSSQVSSQIRIQIRDQIRDQVWNQVSSQISNQIRIQVCDQVWNQVHDQVSSQVIIQVHNQIISQVHSQVENYFSESYDANWFNAGWVAYYDYFTRINLIKNDLFTQYKQGTQSNIFALILQENFCLISKPPTQLHRDDRGSMHCVTDAAVKFKDGYSQHYLWGVYFSPVDFQKYVITRVSAKELFAVENQEQKAALIKLYGYEKLISELPENKVVDTLTKQGKQHILYAWKLSSQVQPRFLMVEDFSTDKKFFLGVPSTCKTVVEALAWTFNVPTKVYGGLRVET